MTARKKGRAAKGDGSVYYDANAGKWAAVLAVPAPGTGKRSRRVKMTAPDKPTAQRHLRKMIAERDETGQVSRRDYTVGQCLADYLAHPPASWRSGITVRINTHLADRLARGLGGVKLSRLTAGQVNEHLRQEVTAGLAHRTVRDEKALLKRAISRAEAHDLVTRNVAGLAEMPAGATTRASRSMTIPQMSQLLTSGLDPWWKAWLTTALALGLRPGELGALRWSDVDLDARVLRVRHSLHETPDGLVPGDLKTEKSHRTLGMPKVAARALAAWKKEQAQQRLHAGPAWQGTGNMIFTDGFGRAVSRQRLHRGFRAVCQAAGVARPDGQPFQIRELRHTWVSVLSHGGVDIEQIADAAGHVNSSVTRVVYRHQLADQIQVAATVMDQIFETGGTP